MYVGAVRIYIGGVCVHVGAVIPKVLASAQMHMCVCMLELIIVLLVT